MLYRLPIPRSWQDFEAICHALWKEIWSDPNAQLNGRVGQPQHGVDVFGRPLYSSQYAGVQCKDRDGRLGSTLLEAEFIKECDRARGFTPTLEVFTVATTAPRDANIQAVARQLNIQGSLPFNVHVWSWDDIDAELQSRPRIVHAYFREFFATTGTKAVISVSAPLEQFAAFFGRPAALKLLGGQLRERTMQVLYELCDNAFVHGGATTAVLSIDGAELILEDNGGEFDPLRHLDATKASATSHLGSLVFRSFQNTFRNDIQISYDRVPTETGMVNRTQFRFLNAVNSVPHNRVDITVNFSPIFGRQAAEHLAESIQIPTHAQEVVFSVEGFYNLSAFAGFVLAMRARLAPDVTMTIYYPADEPDLTEMFRGRNVTFVAR